MIVRDYNDADFERLKALHSASGFGYDLPDFSGKEFFSRHVISDSNDITMAAFLKLSAEAYLICSPTWRTPAWRMEALRQLHGICREDAIEKKVADVNAFLPPEIAKKFGPRLRRLGWNSYVVGQEWPCFSYEVSCG